MEKNKYCDNRLAEEFDIIVLTNNDYKPNGFPSGSLGTLTRSYTGRDRPLYGLLINQAGTRKEQALKLHDFRVLNEGKSHDCSLIAGYMLQLRALRA